MFYRLRSLGKYFCFIKSFLSSTESSGYLKQHRMDNLCWGCGKLTTQSNKFYGLLIFQLWESIQLVVLNNWYVTLGHEILEKSPLKHKFFSFHFSKLSYIQNLKDLCLLKNMYLEDWKVVLSFSGTYSYRRMCT